MFRSCPVHPPDLYLFPTATRLSPSGRAVKSPLPTNQGPVPTPFTPPGTASRNLLSSNAKPPLPGGGFLFPNQSSCPGHAPFMIHVYKEDDGNPGFPLKPVRQGPAARTTPQGRLQHSLSSLLEQAPASPAGACVFWAEGGKTRRRRRQKGQGSCPCNPAGGLDVPRTPFYRVRMYC